MKTETHFYTRQNKIKKTNTIQSQININQHKKSTFHQNARKRIKTMMSLTNQNQSDQLCNLLFHDDQTISYQSPKKMQKQIDICDEQNQYLTTDFANDWERMGNAKKQIYSKLRSRFVRKFPQYRSRYKRDQIEQQALNTDEKLSKTQISIGKSTLNQTIRESTHANKPQNLMKAVGFYSISKKKCMYNSFTPRPSNVGDKEVFIPKISFMTYIKKHDEMKNLNKSKIKGYSMIQVRDKILKLQKQGTQSYISLKKCLEDAIEDCALSK